MPPRKPPQPLTLSAYAAHRKAAGLPGGSVASVQGARDAGRLSASLTKDGRIASAAAADAEWEATTKAKMRPHTGPSAQAVGGDRLPGRPRKSKADVSGLAESTARKAAADAGLAELKLGELRGELVRAESVESKLVAAFASCRTKLLGVPARARQQDPGLTPEQIALFEALVREACEALSGAGEEES
jgi:hypothetical protein